MRTNTNNIKKTNSAIGFSAVLNGSPETIQKIQVSIDRALAHFKGIHQLTLQIGRTTLSVWGRGKLDDCCHRLPDDSFLILIGSPLGDYSWTDIEEQILASSISKPFILPWEGRVILLRIDPQRDMWIIWNDWLGSIPVFHTQITNELIVSTLEPAVVNGASVTAENIFLPSVLALLMWGHFISDWTLFKNVKVIPPDCKAIWVNGDFSFSQHFSVIPTDTLWESGWDDLMEEMYTLSREAIIKTLNQHTRWLLPLSSGLDSRLIAGVAAKQGANIQAYTWGTSKSSDVIHGKKIAQILDIPWKYLSPGKTYLTTYKQRWMDLFGSAMHFHGMYQMPFLDATNTEPSGPFLSGFIGECLTGYDVKFLMETHSSPYPFQISPDGYLHWTIKEFSQLLNIPIDNALEELTLEVYKQIDSIPGPLFHQLRYFILWGRQRHFTYYQTMLADYWRGVSTPYLNRDYARFSFSLPRAVLDNRVLQQAMLRRYYPKLAAIPGTYAPEPALLTGTYLLKKRFSKHLPNQVTRIIFPGLVQSKLHSDIECVKCEGKEAFKLVFDYPDLIEEWMNMDVIEKNFDKIISENDINAVRKLQSIETLVYCLMDRKTIV